MEGSRPKSRESWGWSPLQKARVGGFPDQGGASRGTGRGRRGWASRTRRQRTAAGVSFRNAAPRDRHAAVQDRGPTPRGFLDGSIDGCAPAHGVGPEEGRLGTAGPVSFQDLRGGPGVDQEGDVPEVRPPTIDDVRRICRALDEAGARYVLIGGFTVILHGASGRPRTSICWSTRPRTTSTA